MNGITSKQRKIGVPETTYLKFVEHAKRTKRKISASADIAADLLQKYGHEIDTNYSGRQSAKAS